MDMTVKTVDNAGAERNPESRDRSRLLIFAASPKSPFACPSHPSRLLNAPQGRGITRRLQLRRLPPSKCRRHLQGWQVHHRSQTRVRLSPFPSSARLNLPQLGPLFHRMARQGLSVRPFHPLSLSMSDLLIVSRQGEPSFGVENNQVGRTVFGDGSGRNSSATPNHERLPFPPREGSYRLLSRFFHPHVILHGPHMHHL